MTLNDRQIEKLKSLAESEQEHATLARGMLDLREAEYQAGLRLQGDIRRLEEQRSRAPDKQIAASIDEQLATLKSEYARTVAANERRQQTANEHNDVSCSIRAAIDAVLAHAGTSRRRLGINFFRDDPQDLSYLTRSAS